MGASQNGILRRQGGSTGCMGFETERQLLPFCRSRSVGTQTAWRILGVLWGLLAPGPTPAVGVLGLRADLSGEPHGRAQWGVF